MSGWGSAEGAYSAPPDLLPGFMRPASKGSEGKRRERIRGKKGKGEGREDVVE